MANNIFEREAIANIQKYLRQISFQDQGSSSIPIDGIWDSRTAEAIIEFQKENGLPITGTVDRATFEILKEKYDNSVAQNSPPVALDLFPRAPKGFEIKKGDRGFLVTAVQYLLDQLERVYGYVTPPQSGVFDEITELALLDFQKRNSIPQTGRVDRESWDALVIQHNLLDKYRE